MPASRWIIAAFLAAVGTLAAFKMCQDVDNDLFWQLKDGERIVREGRLPVREDYSFTVPGKPLVATEWLAEAVSCLVFRAGGYGGLVLFNTGLFLLAFALLLGLLRRSLPLSDSLCLLALTAFAFLNFYGVRAQNWTFLFTALFLYWAALWDQGNAKVPWAMAAVLCPWANMHGGFMIGWAILALVCLKRCWETPRLAELAPWGLGTALCCVHPSGVTALIYPLWFMAAPPPGRALIVEWRAVNFAEPSATPYLLLLAFLLWLGLDGVSTRFPWGGLTLALAVMALRGRKLLPEFTMAAAAVLAQKLAAASSPWVRRALRAAAAASLAAAAWVVLSRPIPRPSRDWEHAYPREAAELIAARFPGARVFHDYDWGGYLIYKLYPKNLVFIDGRLDPYWRLLTEDYSTLLDQKPGWKKLLDDYGITVALLKPADRLALALSQEPGWKIIRGDSRSILFAR